MTKSTLVTFFSILLIGSGIVSYRYYQSDTPILHEAHNTLDHNQDESDFLTKTEKQVCSVEDGSTVMISYYDGLAYVVALGETLGDAIAQGALAQEKGNCVREDSDNPPDKGEVACKCHEQTGCGGQESSTCKRHCKRNLCKCCPGV